MTDPVPSKELERELEENLARARQRVNEVFNNGWADSSILHLLTAFYALQNYRERAAQPPGDVE